MAVEQVALRDQPLNRLRARADDLWSSHLAVRVAGRWALRFFMFFLFALAWELVVDWGWIAEVTVSRPTAIAEKIWDIYQTTLFWEFFRATVLSTLAGLGIGMGIGLSLAVTIVLFPWTRFIVSDYAVAFEAIPKVTLVPVLVTAFGFGLTSKLLLAAIISFFPIFLTTLAGVARVPEDNHRLLSSYQVNRIQRFYMLQFPHALPNFFGGLKVALANAIVGTILAEFLLGNEGLGFMIKLFFSQLKVADLFSVMIAVSLTALMLFFLLDLMQRKIAFWVKPLDQAPMGG